MLICRYADSGQHRHGRIDRDDRGEHVVPVEYHRSSGRWVPRTGRARPIDEVTLLPPAEPSKIVCLALNYSPGGRASADASGVRKAAPVLLKPPSSLAAPGDLIRHPGADWELRHEAELAVVVATACKRVPAEHAAEVVAGYTCANDITAYARRQPDDPVTGYPSVWAKHFDGFTPLGPWLATDLDPADLEITCRVDGETRQQAGTRDLIWPVHEVIALVSEHMTLMAGDVILTGTPAGSSSLPIGSRVEVSITGIGTLHNVVDMPSGALWVPEPAHKGASPEETPAGRTVRRKERAGR